MDWDSPRSPPLGGRLARLRQDLDEIADQAREAAAAAVGRSVAGAVAEVLLAALSPVGRRDRPTRQPFRSYPDQTVTNRDGGGLGWGRDDDRRGRHDPYDPDDDLGYDGDEAEPGFEDARPRNEPRGGRRSLALALGLRAAAWWLGRPGRASIPAALAVGALAALAGHALLTPNDDEDSTNP